MRTQGAAEQESPCDCRARAGRSACRWCFGLAGLCCPTATHLELLLLLLRRGPQQMYTVEQLAPCPHAFVFKPGLHLLVAAAPTVPCMQASHWSRCSSCLVGTGPSTAAGRRPAAAWAERGPGASGSSAHRTMRASSSGPRSRLLLASAVPSQHVPSRPLSFAIKHGCICVSGGECVNPLYTLAIQHRLMGKRAVQAANSESLDTAHSMAGRGRQCCSRGSQGGNGARHGTWE